jgi:serine/threonine protein kinase
MDNISSINNTEFKVESYIGKKGQYDAYIVNNKNDGRKYICKSRTSSKPEDVYEKDLYKYLAKQGNLTKFINPLQTQIIDPSTNKTHSFYPILNGIPLSAALKHLRQLEPTEQEVLSRVIIKNLLEALGNLHKIQIIHNAITPDNIILVIGEKPLAVKLVNFDFSCGKFLSGSSYKYKKCNSTRKIYNGIGLLNNNHNKVPQIVAQELKQRKTWDVFSTGLIALQLILGDSLPWEQIRIHRNSELNNIYWNSIRDTYLTNSNSNDKIQKGYINLILNNLIEYPFFKNNNPAKYTVDKIIILEKYS